MKRRMIQCATVVNRDAVRRESIGGIEHVIISSFTLPDNIVMNGLLYPAEEIEAGFPTLERTLAPVEHPVDSNGNFISAGDPEAIHNFHAGAFNVNVSRDKGRVHIEKFINVQEALKSDRGRRLLDRINELETSESPRPVHTSVGVFINVEETDGVQTNEVGQEFTAIARDMLFDHDAILLDSVGAAQPDQGVGMAVNRDGSEIKVDRFVLNADDLAGGSSDKPTVRDMRANDDHGLSVDDLHDAVIKGLERSAIRFDWIHDLFSDQVVFTSGDEFFIVPFTLDETTGMVTIMGIPLPVERSVSFTPKVNKGDDMKLITNGQLADRLNRLLDQRSDGDAEARSELIDRMASAAGISRSTVSQILRAEIEIPPEDRLRGFAEVLGVSLESLMSLVDNSEEGDAMKQAIVNALKKADVQTDGLSDDQLLAKYNELQANQSEGDGDDAGNDTAGIAGVVANAMKPFADKLDSLESKMNADTDKAHADLVAVIANSDKYPGIDEATAKLLPIEKLREMSANCGNAHGIPMHNNSGENGESTVATEMPE